MRIRCHQLLVAACAALFATTACRAAPGDLDTAGFGLGFGKVIQSVGSSDDMATALALQPDGKMIVAGYCANGTTNLFCLARFLPSGALDTSFNTTGKLLVPVGPSNDFANALALQPDGKMIVAGFCYNGTNQVFCLVRLLPSGALDTTFNATGKLLVPVGSSHDSANALMLQPDGKIVVAGSCSNSINQDLCLVRLLPSGALDTTFNATGKLMLPVGSGIDIALALALQPDGKIVVAGYCDGSTNQDFCLARLLPSGALDTSFNATGKLLLPVGASNDYAYALALQPDGKIVVAGNCSNGTNQDFCLARLEGGPFDARNCSMDIDGDGVVLPTTDALIHARVARGLTGNAVLTGITFASHASRQTWPAIREHLVAQCGMSIAP